jgi:hypothetical protein
LGNVNLQKYEEVNMRALLLAALLLGALIGPPARADDAAAQPSRASLHQGSLGRLYADLLIARRPHAQSPILPVQASEPVSCTHGSATCCCKHGPITQQSWACMSQSDCEGPFSGVCVDRFQPATMSEANNNHCKD